MLALMSTPGGAIGNPCASYSGVPDGGTCLGSRVRGFSVRSSPDICFSSSGPTIRSEGAICDGAQSGGGGTGARYDPLPHGSGSLALPGAGAAPQYRADSRYGTGGTGGAGGRAGVLNAGGGTGESPLSPLRSRRTGRSA